MASGGSGAGTKVVARVLAVVAAAALIAGGLLVRRAIDDDDDGAGEPAGTTDVPPAANADVVCITELEAVCTAMAGSDVAVTIEPAGDTLDRLAALEDPSDAPVWITIDPFPTMVDSLREGQRREPIGYSSSPASATAIGIVLPAGGRWPLLVEECGPRQVWRCIGDWAGDDWAAHGGDAGWGSVRPSVGDPIAGAMGLAALAEAVAGYTGTSPIDTLALSTDPDFTTWLDGLAGTVPADELSGSTPLATMVVRPSQLDVAAATDAEFGAIGPAQSTRFEIQYPELPMWATAVLASPADDGAPDELVDRLGAALTAAGWNPAGEATTPLPDAGTMLALRELWRST